MKDLWDNLKTARKPIVLYGMGNGADLVLSVCEKYGIKVSGVFASEGFVRDKTFHGMPVTGYAEARRRFGDMIVLLCFGTSRREVLDNIMRIASENELYAPDVPVCGEGLFCREYYEARGADFDKIYSLLADETSKNTFNNIIMYKLSGDIKYLFDCETDENEPFENFLHLTGNEDYLDLGAYRGDTVLSFVNRTGGYKSIVAVEPDIKSYKKLCDTAAKLENIVALNAFAGEGEGTRLLNMNGSRGGGAFGGRGEVKVISADSLGRDFSFVKMDIEGDEGAAIAGAADLIRRARPKMQIAAYHRHGDLADIPAAVLSIRNDYKIYLRRRRCLPAWDVDYFFI